MTSSSFVSVPPSLKQAALTAATLGRSPTKSSQEKDTEDVTEKGKISQVGHYSR